MIESTFNIDTKDIINLGKEVLKVEAQSILSLDSYIDDKFLKAVEIICGSKGKLIITGTGKSGLIGKKLSATFSSTGTPSMFLHPTEALHGDLGIISKGDVVLGISYSGKSPELLTILKYCKRLDIPFFTLTGNLESELAIFSDIGICCKIDTEACPLGLAPTSSSTATLAMGDAIAMATLKHRGFSKKDFAERHPAGALGARLLTKVEDIMHSGDAFPILKKESGLKEILKSMTAREVRGAACVIDNNSNLIGAITDGDIRRHFEATENPNFSISAFEIMNSNPLTIAKNEMAESALSKMEKYKVQMLIVTDENGNTPLGILGIQDLLNAKIK